MLEGLFGLLAAHLATAVFLAVPVTIGGALHMVVVKTDSLAFLNLPIHSRWFGKNKTWRGLVAMPVLTVFGVVVAAWFQDAAGAVLLADLRSISPLLLGTALGLAYIVSELPNSYVKRRLGIAPGKVPRRNRRWFVLADQTDSAIGCVLVYSLLLEVPAASLLACVLLGPVLHLIVNRALYTAGLRREPT